MSIVSFEEFASEFAKDLGIIDDYFLRVPLRKVGEFDSMGKISVSLTIERLFQLEIPYEVLDTQESVQTLYEHCLTAVRER